MEERLRKHGENVRASMKLPKIKLEGKTVEKNNVIKNIAIGIGTIAASFVIVVNCAPGIAYATREIPVFGSVINVITFGRYNVETDSHEANIVTPKIEGLLNKELEQKLNNEFKENSAFVIAAFEQDVKEMQKEFGEDFHLGVDASYVVRTDNDEILAIDTYIVNTVASSSTRHKFYTISKKTGQLLKLADLFKENADYIIPISEYITAEMIKQNESGVEGYWIGKDGFGKIKKDQSFFINDNGNLVISFDKYEVAIGAFGCPEFEIPNEVIKDILK